MSKNTKTNSRLLAACVALICLVSLLAPSALAGQGAVTLTVKQVFAAGMQGGAFSYSLAPAAASNPMPAGSGQDGYILAITGTNDIDIGPVTFTQAGIYIYELKPISACACALETYLLEIYVENDLKTSVVARKPDGSKAIYLQFGHNCGKAPETTAPHTTKPPGGDGPKTGDESQLGLYLAMFGAASAALTGTMLYLLFSKRRKKRYEGTQRDK